MLGFYKELYFRPSCKECPFATRNRYSDITMGDFFGINNVYKNLDAHKGVSLCIANSQKGKSIMSDLKQKIDVKIENPEIAIKNNTNLSGTSVFSKNREEFFDSLKLTNNFKESITPFVRKRNKLEFLIRRNLNEDLKSKIKRIIKKN